jgi:N-acyl amino acid synthase of PEP-CTERM/exosortase system
MIINRFETVLADTAAARQAHYQLRYRVFCEEARFEEASRFPDEQERDEYDPGAAHFIVWDRLSHEWVGAMRLVPASEKTMPSEAIAGRLFAGSDEERTRSTEFSRLCVRAQYARTDSGFRIGHWAPPGSERSEGRIVFFRQWEHEIIQRLIYASLGWQMANGFDYTYFIINRALARVLKRFGVPLEVVGEPLEHRGTRIPHRGIVRATYAGMRAKSADFAEMADSAPAYIPYSDLELQARPPVNIVGVDRSLPCEVVSAAQAKARASGVRAGAQVVSGNASERRASRVA